MRTTTSSTHARVEYAGRSYFVNLRQMTVQVRIPNDRKGCFPVLRNIDWHGPVGRAVRLRASHAAQA